MNLKSSSTPRILISASHVKVLELCEGGPITQVSDKHSGTPIPEPRARNILRQIALGRLFSGSFPPFSSSDSFLGKLGLAYLHENGIVHRDIKPENCLFLADLETVKIVDFGISEMFVRHDTIEKSAGSPAFMAPELCVPKFNGQIHGVSCDMWSLGECSFSVSVPAWNLKPCATLRHHPLCPRLWYLALGSR